MTALNKNNSAVKRIMQEARELANDPCTDYSAGPLEDDIFEWHCTLRGPSGTEFEGGLYHFRILLPAEYPFRPPSIMILTPNGRFELNTKICISFTSYHEELWQPAWGVRTAIIGLQGFFPLKGQAAVGVGSIEYPAGERKRLAALSRDWTCPHCKQPNIELLPDPPATNSHSRPVGDPTDSTSAVPPVIEAPSGVSDSTATAACNAGQSDGVGDGEQPTLPVTNSDPPLHELTDAQKSDMQAMAQALHDKLNRLQRDEEAETLRSISSSRPLHTGGPPAMVARDVSALSPSPRTGTAGVETPATPATPAAPVHMRASQRSAHKPPILLDTAICILLVLLFAIICRRMV